MRFLVLAFLLLSSFSVWAQQQYQVCFTPAQYCTPLLVTQINSAKRSIHVQAYSFTSKPIIEALINAHNRGIEVWVIIDKGQYNPAKRKAVNGMLEANIPAWVDWIISIQHNKVMIIDGQEIITGSFNFSKSADIHNAENLLLIHDDNLAKKYEENFLTRLAVSKRIP